MYVDFFIFIFSSSEEAFQRFSQPFCLQKLSAKSTTDAMDADVVISLSDSQKYSITRSFKNGTREFMCFSYIVDQILADTSTEDRQKTTYANVLSSFFRSSDTWQDLKRLFGKYDKYNTLRNKSFTARFELVVEDGLFGSYVDLEKEYQPRNPHNLDGKLSVSTTLYAICLAENLSPEDEELMLDVLNEQYNYYEANGFPSWGNRGAPAQAAESVLRY